MINIQKAAIIGCGFVGTSIAFSLVQKGIFSELVLIDANEKEGGRGGDGFKPWTAVYEAYGDQGRRL